MIQPIDIIIPVIFGIILLMWCEIRELKQLNKTQREVLEGHGGITDQFGVEGEDIIMEDWDKVFGKDK